MLTDLLIFILICFGAANIVATSKIFRFLNRRRWVEVFFGCVMCMGFWWGVFFAYNGMDVGIMLFKPEFQYWHLEGEHLRLFAHGCLGSGASWIIFVILEKLGARDL